MSDSMILYAGIFCFGFILLAFVLTIIEFRQMRHKHNEDATDRPRGSP